MHLLICRNLHEHQDPKLLSPSSSLRKMSRHPQLNPTHYLTIPRATTLDPHPLHQAANLAIPTPVMVYDHLIQARNPCPHPLNMHAHAHNLQVDVGRQHESGATYKPHTYKANFMEQTGSSPSRNRQGVLHHGKDRG